MTMQIQHRMQNPANPVLVGIGIAAVLGVGAYLYMRQKEEDEGDGEEDVEVIPFSAWNPDPNAPGVLQNLQAGQRYRAVFSGPLTEGGEIPDYAIEYIPGFEAFSVHDVEYDVQKDENGNPVASIGRITFTPKHFGEQKTALIVVTSNNPQTFQQLHIEIE